MEGLIKILGAIDSSKVPAIKKLPNQGKEWQFYDLLPFVYTVLVIVAVGMIVKSGYDMNLANGDPGGFHRAKMGLLYAVAGLIIVLLAAAITFFVISNVAEQAV